MEQITANHPLSKSAEIIKENVDTLKALFPTIVKEGKIDVEELKALLGEEVETSEEYYRFTWAGKSQARQEANKPSTGTLRPVKGESKDWDNTKNIFIEGDNLEVLKLLQKSYGRDETKVKMIYIDPPYNTGKDFVYKDNYADNLSNYLMATGQIDAEGKRLSTNTESDGRYHSNWLNMMYPRLKLARNILKDDGVIFISIDDNEVHNLRKVCDEIYGEENFLGCAARISKKANNQGDFWSPNFDYILSYAKNVNDCKPFFGGVNYSAYDQVETEGPRKGEKFQLLRLYMTSLDPMRGCTNQRYYIECPDGTLVIPPGNVFPEIKKEGERIAPHSGDDKVWRWSISTFLQEKDRIVVKRTRTSNLVDKDGNPTQWNVFTKTYLNDVIKKSSAKPNSLVEEHINQLSSHELNELSVPFDFAKPSSLITYLAEISCIESGDIVLDFFAGSGSTAQGVFSFNKKNNSDIKFICVQLPQMTDPNTDEYKAGFKTISEITKERIRRAGDKIKSEMQAEPSGNNGNNLDIGFRVFKLDSSNINAWDGSVKDFEQNLLSAAENIKPDRTEEDVLYEILLKSGLDLAQPIEEKKIAGKKVFNIGLGALFICLANKLDTSVAEGIGKWKQELEPSTCRVIFKDTGFNDVEKTNSIQILKRYGINEVNTI